MNDLIKCESCKGRKRYLGMGGIYKDCKACKGIGWTEQKLDVDTLLKAEKTLDQVLEEPKKRMGRPPKVKDEG